VDATDRVGRAHLWRACEMMLSGGGRLYLELLVSRGDATYARAHHLHPVPLRRVVEELEASGATVLARRRTRDNGPDAPSGHRIGRLVVEWQR
jgi:hypothetical protein